MTIAQDPDVVARMPPRCICLIGIDGVGKTTHIEKLATHFDSKPQRSVRRHVRRPYLFSLPLLAYARVRGYTQYKVVNGTKHGRWEFYNSKTLSMLLPLFLLVDAAISTIIALIFPLRLGINVICDRCSCDTLVDLMLAIDDELYFEKTLGRHFLSILPKDALVLLLDHGDIGDIVQRREDLAGDDTLMQRRDLYLALGAYMAIPVISTSQSIAETWQDILTLVEET